MNLDLKALSESPVAIEIAKLAHQYRYGDGSVDKLPRNEITITVQRVDYNDAYLEIKWGKMMIMTITKNVRQS